MNTQGWNRYSYIGNRSLSGRDPSGFTEEVVVTARRENHDWECESVARRYGHASWEFEICSGGFDNMWPDDYGGGGGGDGGDTASGDVPPQAPGPDPTRCYAPTATDASLPTQIAIGYTTAPHTPNLDFNDGNPFRHAFVVAFDPVTGMSFGTRAGPRDNFNIDFANGIFDIWQTLQSETGIYGPSFTDSPDRVVALQPVGSVDLSLNDVFNRMQDFGAVTDAAQHPYFGLVGLNSNSYAFTFVESLGFKRPEPMAGINAPLSDRGVFSPNLRCAQP